LRVTKTQRLGWELRWTSLR